MSSSNSIGRYAPSPTGDLHLGNLRTALLAWLHARLQNGKFLLRIEDLDAARVVKGSADKILADLEWLGIDWDGPVVYQSQRTALYEQALHRLELQELVYPCFCSRRDIQMAASAPHGRSPVYPGTCAILSTEQILQKSRHKTPALRIRVGDTEVEYSDGVLGQQQEVLKSGAGDFVIKRADGVFAYQLAVVVDDQDQQITDVVRGADLADSVARQLYLAVKLAPHTAPIRYWHVALMRDAQNRRMAKRDGSQSATAWRRENTGVENLIGLFAAQLGLLPGHQALTAIELLETLDLPQFTEALQRTSR